MSTNYNITIRQGDDYTFQGTIRQSIEDVCNDDCSFVNMDLTDNLVKAEIRRTYNSCEAFTFIATKPVPEEGLFQLFIPAYETALMKPATYVWDVIVTPDSTANMHAFTAFSGTFTVLPRATKVVTP